jgi:pyruvate dehydrogenase E2 component (dihydrolipoamide acetyltransferase)
MLPLLLQGNIAKWHVKPGDEIAPGTVLADIETDKATLAFENQDDGFIAALLMPDGAKDIPVGEPVAIIVEEEADIAAFSNYSSSSSEAAAPAGAAAAAPPAASQAAEPAQAAGGSFPDYTVRSNTSAAYGTAAQLLRHIELANRPTLYSMVHSCALQIHKIELQPAAR